jgi:hypothetical protein
MHRFLLFGVLALAWGSAASISAQETPATSRRSSMAKPGGRTEAPGVGARVAKGRPATAAAPMRSTILPGTAESAFTTVQGNALNANNGALANSAVRLRDARLGRIVDTQLTDHAGLFSFRTVDPGNYIVELLGPSERVLAASQMLSVSGGEVISAIVKLPFRIPPFAELLGQTSASAAATVLGTAASSGVMIVVAPGTAVSP